MVEPKKDVSDAGTLLVARHISNKLDLNFRYETLNPATMELFQPPSGKQVKRSDAEPLVEGYTNRFLRISDGTNGRMSSRWGRNGSKGSISGGLN